ncbi:hypothetical protein Sango_0496200 [Sesamum angolense]|uniref:Uncharacterized protein n=1 Tax=Sesamum angolense TaxID=2727404 RepID=A0AAE1XCX1_9LAMI|nr:hypothetical protein Sango_0496200 [Sesamum angolense]
MGEPNPRSRGGKSNTQSMRCPHCAGPLAKEMETSEWTVPPLIRDSFSMDQPLAYSGRILWLQPCLYDLMTSIAFPVLIRNILFVLPLPFTLHDYKSFNAVLPSFVDVHYCPPSEIYLFDHVNKEGSCDKNIFILFCLNISAVMPIVRKWIKGPMWVHFLIGAPPVIVFSSGCAGGSIPALAQLASSSYHAFASSSPSPPSSS